MTFASGSLLSFAGVDGIAVECANGVELTVEYDCSTCRSLLPFPEVDGSAVEWANGVELVAEIDGSSCRSSTVSSKLLPTGVSSWKLTYSSPLL